MRLGKQTLRKLVREELSKVNEMKYSNQTGLKSSILRTSEFTSLLNPKEMKWIRGDNVRIYKDRFGFVFTDGKREMVFNLNKPFSVVKPIGNARSEIKKVYQQNESVLNERPNKKEIEKLASELERQWRMNSGAMSVMIDDIPDKQMDKIRANFRKQAEKQLSESINEGISVFDERHFGKNGIIIMIDDNGKKVSAIFKNKKNANKYNRNKESDLKALLSLAKKTPYPKAIDESINESILSEKKPSKIVWDTKKISAAKRINVRKWYMKTYPSDELGDEINQKLTLWDFYNALSQNRDIYKVIGVGDSVVRERIFEKLSKILGVAYDTIYNMWESINEANGKVDLSLPFAVIRKGGSIGSSTKNYIPTDKGVIVSTFNNQNDAKEEAASLRKTLSPQAKQYYKTTYTVTKLTDYKRKLIKNKTESINEASDEFVIYVEKDNGRKKLLHNNKSSRAAKMFITKNANKILNQPGIRAVGSMRKSDWERDEAQYAENIKKKGMRTVTKKQWDRTHNDYKGMIKGQPYMMWFDKKTQSTVYGPVQIKESVNKFDLNEKKYKTTATKSELKTAYELGVKAFNRGIKRAPMLDKNLVRMLKGKEVADTSSIDIMDAWLKAWDTTNLKAPVGESVNEAVITYGIEYKSSKNDRKFKKASLTKTTHNPNIDKMMIKAISKDAKSLAKQDGWVDYRITKDGVPVKESVNEGKDDFVARHGKANIILKKGYKHHKDTDLEKLYDKLGSLVKGLKVKDVTLVFESVNEGRAFVAAAKKAKEEGKTEFEFNGKTYPVTIKEVLRKRNRKLR